MLAMMLLLAAQDPGPMSGDWLAVGEGGGMIVAIDEAATSREGDLVTLGLRAERPEGPTRWEIASAEFDCRSELLRLAHILEYGADGALLRRRGPEPPAGQPGRRPTASRLAILQAACHRTGWGEEGAAE